MLYIGVDLGTSSVKLLLMDESGRIENIVIREYPIYYPKPGWSEQNPEDWYNALTDGLKELIKNCNKDEIDGISFSGQMHGMVILDEHDRVIRPAILWNDGRTQAECDYLNNDIGREKISGYTANLALTGFTAPKLLWVRKHEPENFVRIKKVMLPKDYIAYMLSGVQCTDVSDASGMLLFDVKNKRWSEEMLEICGLKKSRWLRFMNPMRWLEMSVRRHLKRQDFLQVLRLLQAVVIRQFASVGTGTVGRKCNVSLGTSGVVFISAQEFAVDDKNALHAFCHADGKYHFMGVMLSAGASNSWWMNNVLDTKDYTSEQKDITGLGRNNVYFLPYLMGERTPHNNPNARGTFIGMTMDTTRKDMTQAVLEGVAFALRDSFEIAKSIGTTVDRIRINGGGAKSPLWCKIVANVLNVKVDKTNSKEEPAFGAAILAAVGCGKYKTVEVATEKLIQVIDTVEQDPEIVELYNKKYEVFRQLYPAVKDIFDKVSG